MPRNKIYIYDQMGNVAQTVNGIQIDGPVVGARSINYVPEGAIASAIGTASFELPLEIVVNNAVVRGTQIMIYQEDVYDGPVFWGRVTRRPRTLSTDGVFARVDCVDVMAELVNVTCTSGFISRPGELYSIMLQRLLSLQTETLWSVRLTIPDGPANFSAYGIEVLRAIGKFAGEHFSSYKRETFIDSVTNKPKRRIVVGQFANESSGLRLLTPQKEYSSVPYENRPAEIRAVVSASFDDDATIINRLIPFAGSDITAASITLEVLYGRTNFTGYNNLYPVQRRLRSDITDPTPLPGQQYPNIGKYWEYYVEDHTSIVTNRVSEAMYPRQDITPLSTNPGDIEVAATTLYAAAVNYIIDHINPHLSLDIVTEHRGDLRNIGGKTVYVRCQAINKKKDTGDIYTMDIDGNFRVVSVEVNNADAEGTCKWNISSDGRSVETDDILFQGALEDIDYLKKVPTILVAFPIFPINDFIDASNNLVVTFPNSKAFISKQEVILDLRLAGVRSALRPLSHQHTFSIASHSHTFSLVAHHHTFSLLDHKHTITPPDHTHNMTVVAHTHSVTIPDHSHGASNSASGVTQNVGSHSHNIVATTFFIDPKAAGVVKYASVGKNGESVVTDVQAGTYGSHTHGVNGASGLSGDTGSSNGSAGGFSITTGGASNSGNQTSGGMSNTSPYTSGSMTTNPSGNTGDGGAVTGVSTTDNGAIASQLTDGAGALTNNGTTSQDGAEWGLIIGPKPDIITVYVNGIPVVSISQDTKLDITQYWNVNTDNTLVFVSGVTTNNPTGLGRITGAVMARMLGTTLANQSL